MHDLDLLLATLAAQQHGLASLDQLTRLGFSAGRIDHRRRSGRWTKAAPGVIRLAGAPVTWESELLAGVLALRDAGVVARRAAATLHRFDGFVPGTGPVEFLVERRHRNRRAECRVSSTRRLDRVDVVWVRRPLPPAVLADADLRAAGLVRGFRVTAPSRTILDLAGVLTADELGNALDSACRLGLTSPAYLARRFEAFRAPGRPGVARMAEVVLDSGGHTWLERRFLRLVRAAGLPRPVCQAVHSVDGRFVARVDFDFRPRPLVVEVSGRRGHTSDADRARDARRRNELQALGVAVVEFTRDMVEHQPDRVIDELRAWLARSAR